MKKRIVSLLLVLSMLLCVLPAASAEETAPKFTVYSLSLNKSIAINFKVPHDQVEGKFEKVVFTKNGETTEITTLPAADKDGMAVFTFRDLSPDEMAIPVTATLYVDGQSTSVTRSVKQYCESMLGKGSGNLKKLIVDLLNYGAAFQTYKGQATGLVNADLTDAQKALGTQGDPDLTNNDFVDETNDAILGAGVSLQDSVVLYFVPGEGVSSVKVNDTAAEYNDENGWFYYDKLSPDQMRVPVKAQAYDSNGEKVGGELSYSIVAYANDTNNDDAESAVLKALVKEMIKYGDSAASYVEEPDGEPVVKTVVMSDDFSSTSQWTDYGTSMDSENGQLKLTMAGSQAASAYKYVKYNQNLTLLSKKTTIEFEIKTDIDQNSAFEAGLELIWGTTYVTVVSFKAGTLMVNWGGTAITIDEQAHKVKIEINTDGTMSVTVDNNSPVTATRINTTGYQQLRLFVKGNTGANAMSAYFDNLKITAEE